MMAKDKPRASVDEIKLLRQEIEKFLVRPIRTPFDFTFLSQEIRQQTRYTASESTLKRVWGYITDKGEEYVPSNFTLNALAALIGFDSFESFISKTTVENEIQSEMYKGETISSVSLPTGAIVKLYWRPDRECSIRHIDGNRFIVIESLNSKLIKGDIVECGSFTQNTPLYFNRVDRQSEELMTYIAGSATGVRFEVIFPKS